MSGYFVMALWEGVWQKHSHYKAVIEGWSNKSYRKSDVNYTALFQKQLNDYYDAEASIICQEDESGNLHVKIQNNEGSNVDIEDIMLHCRWMNFDPPKSNINAQNDESIELDTKCVIGYIRETKRNMLKHSNIPMSIQLLCTTFYHEKEKLVYYGDYTTIDDKTGVIVKGTNGYHKAMENLYANHVYGRVCLTAKIPCIHSWSFVVLENPKNDSDEVDDWGLKIGINSHRKWINYGGKCLGNEREYSLTDKGEVAFYSKKINRQDWEMRNFNLNDAKHIRMELNIKRNDILY